jgi:hypothetical protein
MDHPETPVVKQAFLLTAMLVLCLMSGLLPGACSDAAAAGRRTIYRDMFGNDLGPNIPPPRTTGGGWAVYNDGVGMGFSGPASSQGFRNYRLHNNLGDTFWPPY